MDIFGVPKDHKMKKIVLALIILGTVLGCIISYFSFDNYNADDLATTIDEYKAIELSFDEQLMSYMAIWEDSLIYQHIDGDNNKYYIGKYSINNNEHSIIGHINDIVTSSDKIVLLDDILYTYMILMKDDILVNTLISIDLKNGSIRELIYDTEYIYPIVNIFSAKGKVVSLKQKNIEGINVSYYEIYDPATNYIEDRFVFSDDIYAVTTYKYDDTIYVLELYENKKYRISLYDENCNYIESFDLNKIKSICDSMPYKIVIYKDIVYIRNTSDQMVIGLLTNGTVIPIYYGDNMDIVHSCYIDLEPIFYKRNSDEYYTIDFEKYIVKPQNICLPNNYNIQYMISSDDTVLILAKSYNENKEMWYKYDISF